MRVEFGNFKITKILKFKTLTTMAWHLPLSFETNTVCTFSLKGFLCM
jgi:hypothetical protein